MKQYLKRLQQYFNTFLCAIGWFSLLHFVYIIGRHLFGWKIESSTFPLETEITDFRKFIVSFLLFIVSIIGLTIIFEQDKRARQRKAAQKAAEEAAEK
ncbi:MAG: hypothetical protein LBH06_05230 [Rikenellaceae bacterium]|nr:hypothetical protein [Rikenellaceae bacterium]